MICDVCGRNNAETLTFCQDCGRRLRQQRGVAPTPPNGIPKVAPAPSAETSGPSSTGRRPRPEAPVFSFPPASPAERPAASPPAPAPRALAPGVCSDCGAANPKDYKFCVTCGAAIKRVVAEDAATKPEPSKRAPVVLVPPLPVPAAAMPKADPPRVAALPPPPTNGAPRPESARPPAPAADGEKIVGAPVVDIAAAGAAPAKLVTCARCHGHSTAGTRFCKYCGAPFDESSAARRAAPTPAPVERAPEPIPVQAEPPRVARTPVTREAPPAPEPIGKVPLAPMGAAAGRAPSVQPKPPSATPAGPPVKPARPVPATPLPPRPAGGVEPASGPEISAMAGSPAPPEPVHARPPAVAGRARLVVIVEDGSEGRSFSLAEGQLDIGRTEGDIVLEDDPYVSPRHARLRRNEGGWAVRDLDSTNHVYLRLTKPRSLKDGDLLLLGLEVLQFQTVSDGERGLGHAIQHGTLLFGSPATPRRARLCQRTVEGVIRDVYHLFRDETVVGRETGDIVFTADPFLSRRHASIRRNAVTSEFSLVDLDSSNGTYVAIRGEVGLTNGDFLRIGQHLFRVDLG